MPKILAIDDKQDNLITIKALINHMKPGYEVLTAQSGKEGIEIAREQMPDTIILDIIMPEMDGYDTCNILKSDPRTKNIPVLMLTAIKTDTASRIKGLQFGADAFFTKPIDPYELSAQVEVMLRIKQSEDRLRKDKDILIQSVDEKTRMIIQNEEKLNQIIEGFSIPAYVIDTDHHITHWNKALEKLSGFKADMMIGSSNHWKLISPQSTSMLCDHVLEGLDDNELIFISDYCRRSELLPNALESETVFLDENNLEKWYFHTAVMIRDEKGNKLCAMETIQDITKKKAIENELAEHRQHLEKLINKRTKQLEDKNEELERMNKLFVGREFRIKELRDKVKELEEKLKT